MKMTSAIAAVFFVGIAAAYAQAVDIFPNQRHLCYEASDLVTAPNKSAPALVNETLNGFPSLAFRLCTDRWGTHYFLRAPEPVSDSVCSFFEKEVFPPIASVASQTDTRASESAIKWSSPPPPWSVDAPTAVRGELPVQFMAVQNSGTCPPLDSPGYVPVHNVSAEGFRTVDLFWRSLASSEMNFEVAVSRITECRHDVERAALFHNPDAEKKYMQLKIEALHAFLFDRPASLRAFNMYFEAGIYSFWVSSTLPGFVSFEADVQVTPNGLELTKLCNVSVA
jgi:hypothetical protein